MPATHESAMTEYCRLFVSANSVDFHHPALDGSSGGMYALVVQLVQGLKSYCLQHARRCDGLSSIVLLGTRGWQSTIRVMTLSNISTECTEISNEAT
jgi:hypothetical protein